MIRKILMIGISLAALGLSGCNRQDRLPTQPERDGATGSARIALPSLPAGYLADTAQSAWFSLSITGPGMAPILKSWTLSPNHAEPVLVQGIPAGMRAFRGRLVRIDPVNHDTTVTHEGADSAYIQSGSVAEVRLFLHAAGSGSAHVCVEVEGWPADPTCIVTPPPIGLEGCYRFLVTQPGAPSTPDTVVQGKLRLLTRGDTLEGTVDWGDHVDTSVGRVTPDGTIYFEGGKNGFFLKGHPDSLQGNPDSLGFWGFFDNFSGISGTVRAYAISCEFPVPGDTFVVIPKSTRYCYSVTQKDARGKVLTGGLAAERREGHSETDFFLHLKGFDFLVGQGSFTYFDSTAAMFGFRLPVPAKMFPSQPVETADYDVNVTYSGELSASITAWQPEYGVLGSLKGQRRTCSETDFPQ